MLAALVDNFEQVMAEGPNPKKKRLLRQLMKKVLIHDRRTVEVWYGLPNRASVSTPGHLAPREGLGRRVFKNVPVFVGYIRSERTERSANSRTDRGRTPRTRTTAAEAQRAREKAIRGGRGAGASALAGIMYM